MDPMLFAFGLVSFFVSGIFHEQWHARVALWLGDPTGKMENRLSWDPRPHIDPWMTVLLPVILLVMTKGRFVFGGMKPVRINPLNFENPALGMALSAGVGPVSNLLLAGAGLFVLWGLHAVAPSFVFDAASRNVTFNGVFLCVFILTNLVLGAFNILPLPGLDGSRVLYYFLPRGGRAFLDSIEPYAMLITMLIVFNVPVLLRPIRILFYELLRAVMGSPFLLGFHDRLYS